MRKRQFLKNATSLVKLVFFTKERSSLFYNTSVRHERHECDASNTSTSLVRHKQYERDTSDTSATRVLHEQHQSGTSGKF